MPAHRFHALWLAVIFSVPVTIALAQNDDAASVREKLNQAKKEFKEEEKKFRELIEEYFSGYEETARANGDKKTVDRIKEARAAFAQWGDLPEKAPRQQFLGARANLARAYKAAIMDFIRLKFDGEAAAAEEELRKFLVDSAVLADRKTYLVSLKHFNVKSENRWFANNGTAPVANNRPLELRGKLVPHSIFLHPATRGVAEVSYNLDAKWAVIRTTVGIPKIEPAGKPPASPLTFEIVGDGKSLWRSDPAKKVNDLQLCDVRIEGVKVLTLRVHCPKSNAAARAVWYEPVLVER
jgi:hypothetical protein